MKPVPEYEGLIRHLQLEHQKLEKLLLEVQTALEEWRAHWASQAARNDAQAKSHILADEAKRHFDQEETEGCLEEAACHCPNLSEGVACVRKEHVELKRDLDHLIMLVDRNHRDVQSIVDEFTRLKHKLMEHEQQENRLVEAAFGECIAEENGCGCKDATTTMKMDD